MSKLNFINIYNLDFKLILIKGLPLEINYKISFHLHELQRQMRFNKILSSLKTLELSPMEKSEHEKVIEFYSHSHIVGCYIAAFCYSQNTRFVFYCRDIFQY